MKARYGRYRDYDDFGTMLRTCTYGDKIITRTKRREGTIYTETTFYS